MPAHKPEEVHELFAKAFTAGDLERLVSLYEPSAILVPQPGQIVTGHAAIREALRGFLALNLRFELQPGTVLQSEDIAILYSNWSLKGADVQKEGKSMSGRTTDVVRRQPDGTWLVVIDNPYGL